MQSVYHTEHAFLPDPRSARCQESKNELAAAPHCFGDWSAPANSFTPATYLHTLFTHVV